MDLYSCMENCQKSFFIINKTGDDEIEVLKLESLNSLSELIDGYFAFSDPTMSENNPGWPLRNYLIALMYHW